MCTLGLPLPSSSDHISIRGIDVVIVASHPIVLFSVLKLPYDPLQFITVALRTKESFQAAPAFIYDVLKITLQCVHGSDIAWSERKWGMCDVKRLPRKCPDDTLMLGCEHISLHHSLVENGGDIIDTVVDLTDLLLVRSGHLRG